MRLLLGLVVFLSALNTSEAVAQLVRDHDARLAKFHGKSLGIKRSFQSDAEARAVFTKILAASGLAGMEDKITVRASAETSNAVGPDAVYSVVVVISSWMERRRLIEPCQIGHDASRDFSICLRAS